jgi:peptidoglycan hydrolase FlgJ
MHPLNFEQLTQSQESTIPIYAKQKAEEDSLREAAKGFESIMITTVMKQGMKTAREISEEEGESSNQYMDMAYDQLAQYMGDTMNVGLADMLYENLKNRL